MSNLKNIPEYKPAEISNSIQLTSHPIEPTTPAANLLGGSLPGSLVAQKFSRTHDGSVKHKALSLAERCEIQAGLRAGETQVLISTRLGRSGGTISTELRRNGGAAHYSAERAHRAAQTRRSCVRQGHCALTEYLPLLKEVHARLRRRWSPEEIAGKLKLENSDDPRMHTSHESIYRYVYVVARGELHRELAKCLRRNHRTRKTHRRGVTSTQGQIADMTLVDFRPPEVETRLLAGHYEGDLIQGALNRSAVGVLVERTTRYIMLCHLPTKDATAVREAFTRRLQSLPPALRQSLTYDQGKEMAQHKILAADLGLKVYFCHPHSPWERATCESQNGRIRHYLPKGMDLSDVSPQQLRAYQDMLNERPRKILNWKSPAECFQELVAKHSSN